jgi:2-oxoglutarate dehydrogenase E2 component (dihydrolipoamide succinyltransferase)
MSIPLTVPDLSRDGARAHLAAWLVEAGVPVPAGTPLAEIATEKAVVEIAAPADGAVLEPRLAVGSSVVSGQELARFSGQTPAVAPLAPLRAATARVVQERLGGGVPLVTAMIEADLDRQLDHRQPGSPTLTASILHAVAAAAVAVPACNAAWTSSGLRPYASVDLAVVIDRDGTGLVAPVLRGVDRLDAATIHRELLRLRAEAEAGLLDGRDQRGAGIIVSNHGVQGTLWAAPIPVAAGQVLALGVGAARRVPVVARDGAIVTGWRCAITATIDHRALDGHHAGRFLGLVATHLAAGDPGRPARG